MWLCIPCRAILIAILSPSSQFGSPRSPDIECSCNSGPSAKKKAENHPEDTGYIQMPYFWGNGLKQIRIKTIFFFEVDFETWINGFLGKIPGYQYTLKKSKELVSKQQMAMLVIQCTHSRIILLLLHHHHQTSPTIINHSSTNIITIASEVCVKTMKSARSCLGKLPPADAIPVAGDDIGNHHPGHVTAFAMCFTVCG